MKKEYDLKIKNGKLIDNFINSMNKSGENVLQNMQKRLQERIM